MIILTKLYLFNLVTYSMLIQSILSLSLTKLPNDTMKNIIFLRHGTTEMNEQMDEWGSSGFQDKLLYDTRLSKSGIIQCNLLNSSIKNKKVFSEFYSIDLIVSSPLRRTLQTADIALKDVSLSNISKLALPIARERLYLSSDVGRFKSILSIEHPSWNYDLLPENEWWYKPTNLLDYVEWRPKGSYAVPGEPFNVFKDRMIELKNWLGNREEKNILVVSHWGVIKALTGKDFRNCQMESIPFSNLLEEPYIDD